VPCLRLGRSLSLHYPVMAAVGPISAPEQKPEGDSLTVKLLRAAILVVLLGGSIYILAAHREWFENPRTLKAEVLLWGAWGPIAYILLYAVGPSFLVPGAVMTIAGGLAFGAWWGSVWSLAGANLGALIAFAAGRFLGRSFVESVIGLRFRHLLDRLVRNGFYVILYLRIVPVIPYNALNLLAGASPIEFWDYFRASLIGMIPGTILFAFLGDALWHPASPRFFVAVAMIVACFAAGESYRRWKKVVIAA
jgi:uncharacterized membrane protein YdjX (TVP38/TMEM64 family)